MFGSTRQPTESEVKKHHQELNSRLAENGRFDAKKKTPDSTELDVFHHGMMKT